MIVASAPFGNTARAGPHLISVAFIRIFISSAENAPALINNRANGTNLANILASYVEGEPPVWAGHRRSQRKVDGLDRPGLGHGPMGWSGQWASGCQPARGGAA